MFIISLLSLAASAAALPNANPSHGETAAPHKEKMQDSQAAAAYSVVEYHPAPGQFVNLMPAYEDGDTHADMCRHCEEQLADNLPVSLGAFGGYITFGFSKPVENKKGCDVLIKGNAFYSANDPRYGAATIGGSIEPGTVWAGVGDTPETAQWYELAGWEYYTGERHGATITYDRPEAESGTHDLPYSMCDRYISMSLNWTEADGTPRDSAAWMMKNSFRTQSYWPKWETADKLTFGGGLLPSNGVNYGGTGEDPQNPQYWVLYRYSKDAYGYADAAPDSLERYNTFDLDWAVDADGNPVHLTHANFIRVQTGVLQQCGWTGETSTEVCAIENLHLRPGYDDSPITITPRQRPTGISSAEASESPVMARYAVDGTRLSAPRKGINIVRRADGTVTKVLVK